MGRNIDKLDEGWIIDVALPLVVNGHLNMNNLTQMYDITAFEVTLRLWKNQLKLFPVHFPHLISLDSE
jgi:hypothetical protein